jgi:hypothetical protein
MKTANTTFRWAIFLAATLAFMPATHAQSDVIAVDVPAVSVGNESSGPDPICNDFRVLRPILVSQLGMFDSDGDGVVGNAVITVQLLESSPENKGSSLLESVSFDAANPGQLVGSCRFKPLAHPVLLLPGHYTLSAGGFDEANPEYNKGRSGGPRSPGITLNDGGGLVQYLGYHHFNDLTVRSRDAKNMGTPDHFAAGTFMFSAAASPANPWTADYSALTAGVTSFPIDSGKSNLYGNKLALNSYGSLALMEDSAFPVIMEPSGNRLIFEAAAVYEGNSNSARCVAFTHEQFGHALNDARMTLFENAIRWASRKQNPADITMVLTTNMDAGYFRSRGYQVRLAEPAMETNDANPFTGADILVADFSAPQNQDIYNAEFMARAEAFSAKGGGVVLTFLPWRYVHREIRPTFLFINDLLKPFGMAYRSSTVLPVDFGFTTIQQVPYAPVLFNAFPVAELLNKQRQGEVQLGSLERSVAMNTIAYAADRQPDVLEALTEIYSGSSGSVDTSPGGESAFIDTVVFPASQISGSLGTWEASGPELIATSGRGAVEYKFNARGADIYRIQIFGTQNMARSPETNFDLIVSVDGVDLGHQRLQAAYGVSGCLNCLTPYLLPGSHTFRIFWDNPSSWTQLRLQSVHVQSAPGADSNGNGIKDWVEKWVNGQSGLDVTNRLLSSVVSPLTLEGRDAFFDLLRADVSGADVSTPKLAPVHAPNGRFYVNVPLVVAGSTSLRISYQNGARTEVRNVRWVPVDVLQGGTFTVRKGDKLALAARTSDKNDEGEMEIAIGEKQYPRRKVSSPLPFEFNRAGTTNVTCTYYPADGSAPQSGSITVNVVEHHFGAGPDCWVGAERSWNVPLPAGVEMESDSRLLIGTFGQLTNRTARLVIDQSQPRYFVSRLGAGGPILDSGAAQGFNFWSGKETYLRTVQTYPDQSELVEMMMILSPLLPDVQVRMDLIVGGVVFEDGTITKMFTASDFDNLGRCTVRFIRPASAKTSVCHSITLNQGTDVIGYIR